MSDIRKEIRKSFEGLSSEEVLHKLLEAGFNVSKGTGEINIVDDNRLEDEFGFKILTNYSTTNKENKEVGVVFYNIPLVA